jgi:hypothetical protein
VAPPSNGPKGSAVADRLRPQVSQMLGVDDEEVAALNLEQLAERLERDRAELMDDLRNRAATAFDFREIEPNFAHRAASLLLREGLVELISVNWDCGIERAGLRAEVAITGVATQVQRLQLVDELPLFKVHGCARRPQTIALTQAEVDSPQLWAVALVQNAISGGIVVFVGLGTVGLYVREPVTGLLDIWTEGATTVMVVDPVMSELWRNALADNAPEAHLPMGAEEFFDDLLRAAVGNALNEVEGAVQVLLDNEDWASPMSAGRRHLRTALDEVTADSVLHWWRDGVSGTQAGDAFITELPGKRALITVTLLAGREDEPLETRGVRGRLTVATPTQYFEIFSRPGSHVSVVETAARDRIERRIEEGVYTEARTITIVVPDAMGQFPASNAPPDIAAGEDDLTHIDADSTAAEIRLVSAEEGVRGTLAA